MFLVHYMRNKGKPMSTQSNIKNYCLSPGMFRLDGGAMFGIIPKPLWEKKAIPDEYNRIDLDLRLWLIRDGDRNILVDTGIGDYHGQKFDQQFDVRQKKSPLRRLLGELDLTLADITDLIISHLHFDHIGGLTEQVDGKNQCLFPNATIHLHRDHFNYSLNPTKRDSGSFHSHIYKDVILELDKLNRVNWLSGKKGVIIDKPSIRFITSDGHTPHLVHPYTDQLLYLADLIPTSHHIHIPWVMGYDIAPGVTVDDKERFLDFIIENDLKVIFEHDPQYWGATLMKDDKSRIKAKELFKKESNSIQEI